MGFSDNESWSSWAEDYKEHKIKKVSFGRSLRCVKFCFFLDKLITETFFFFFFSDGLLVSQTHHFPPCFLFSP